jgi:hypothetical protein
MDSSKYLLMAWAKGMTSSCGADCGIDLGERAASVSPP